MNTQKFKEWATKTLSEDEEVFVGCSDTPKDKCWQKTGLKYRIAVRDLDQDTYFDNNGVYQMETDKLFDNIDEALHYINTLSHYRIMNSGGQIFGDFGTTCFECGLVYEDLENLTGCLCSECSSKHDREGGC